MIDDPLFDTRQSELKEFTDFLEHNDLGTEAGVIAAKTGAND